MGGSGTGGGVGGGEGGGGGRGGGGEGGEGGVGASAKKATISTATTYTGSPKSYRIHPFSVEAPLHAVLEFPSVQMSITLGLFSAVIYLWLSTAVCNCRRCRASIVRPSSWVNVSEENPPLKKIRRGLSASKSPSGSKGGGGGDGDDVAATKRSSQKL